MFQSWSKSWCLVWSYILSQQLAAGDFNLSSKHSHNLGIMGDLGAEKNHAVHEHIVQKLSVSVLQDVPSHCLSSVLLHSTWKHIQRLVPDRWLGPRLMKHELIHAGGQCELSIIEFIYLAINCSAEVDRNIFIFDKNIVIRDTLTDLRTKIKMLKVTSQLKKIKMKQRLHHPLLVKQDTKIKKAALIVLPLIYFDIIGFYF